MTVRVIGAEGVSEMLRDYMVPKLPKRLQDATKAGAAVMVAPLRAEARKVSKRMARAVSSRKAKRERPAQIITFRPKVAFFRHFVIGGTRDHGPRRAGMLAWEAGGKSYFARRVRGVKPNPMVDRVADRYERQALDALDQSLARSESR